MLNVGSFAHGYEILYEEVRMTEKKYLRKDSRLFHYTPLPVSLLHENIGSTALIIYSVLLGRAMLSLKNGWIDEMGNIYKIHK